MSRYGQYGNYYDPVGSQNGQSSGYTYQHSNPPSSHSGQNAQYATSYQYGANAQNMQQHGTSGAQNAGNSANHAAAALSRMSNQNYAQTSASNRNTASHQYDSSGWFSTTSSAGNPPTSIRSQDTDWPSTYPTHVPAANTGARRAIPEHGSGGSNTVATSSYQNASNARPDKYQGAQRQNQQPPRYNSPLQAVQAQQYAHAKQTSRSSNTHGPSPQMSQSSQWGEPNATAHQQSASVEPSPVTVNPSQVYDNRAELQRKAQIEAEKRRKHEAEQAAKKAEEDRIEAEKRKAEEERQKVEREAAEKEAAKEAEKTKKAEQRRKAREDKKQSKSAADALQKMASHPASGSAAQETQANDEEAEMRAMFQKMREFNAKNPAMLAKLWEEERKTHAQLQAQEQAKAPGKTTQPAPGPAPREQDRSKVSAAASPTPAPATKEISRPTTEALSSSPTGHTRQPSGPASQAAAPIWPAHKKGYLADHTLKWLKSQSKNADNPITSENIFNILDKNPSYVQLCQALESFGLKFDRGSLARVLLSAGPGTFKTQNQSKSGKTNAAEDTAKITAELEQQKAALTRPISSTGPVMYETPQSLLEHPHGVNGFHQHNMPPPPTYAATYHRAAQSLYFAPPQPVGPGGRAASQSVPPQVKEEVKPVEPPRPPANKEEAARKRTFGDLVDLTAQDSDSDDEPPPKRFAASAVRDEGASNAQSIAESTWTAPQGFKQFVYQPPPQPSPYPAGPHFAYGQPKPLWGQQQRQPAVVPSQPHVAAASNEVAPPSSKAKGPTQEKIQTSRMRGQLLVDPIMRDRVARKSRYDSRTIARDVLLATGRHPDMRCLNGHLQSMQKLLGHHGGDDGGGGGGEGSGGGEKGNRSDLSTIRWNIIDPEPPKGKQRETESPMLDDARDELARKREGSGVLRMVEYEVPSRSSSEVQTTRKGRPPKSSYIKGSEGHAKQSLGESQKGPSSAPRPTKATPTSSRLATPSSAIAPSMGDTTMPSGTPVGYAAFRKYNDDGTEIKKKGRPVGWRKSLHSREAQGLAPKTNPSTKQQQPGPKPVPVQQQVEPEHQVYACSWLGCGAKLHNFSTLSNHVDKLHSQNIARPGEADRYECLWRSCVEGRDAPRAFESIASWRNHMNKKHLAPIAWRLGDGPKADSSALRYDIPSETPAYLLDEDGRSVTPIIKPTSPSKHSVSALPGGNRTSTSASPVPVQEPQPVKHPARGRPPKDGIPRAAREGALRSIDAPLKKLEEQKRVIGFTMDRMGCVLADDGRRRGFLDDEDFEDEVSGSEYG